MTALQWRRQSLRAASSLEFVSSFDIINLFEVIAWGLLDLPMAFLFACACVARVPFADHGLGAS